MDIEVEMDTEDGHMMAMAKVVEDNGDQILIDLNHPFAGGKLTYDVEVLDVREQTPEEDLGTIEVYKLNTCASRSESVSPEYSRSKLPALVS